MMNKNTFLFSVAALALSACQHYSDEMAFYYDDENATPEAIAAPTKSVSSKELVIPEDLRQPQPVTPKKTEAKTKTDTQANNDIFDDEEEDDVLPLSQNVPAQNQPQSLLTKKTETTLTKTSVETNTIPVTYSERNESSAQNDSVEESTTTQYDSAEITPKVYAIAATRVTNKMLDATQKIYKQQGNKPKLLVLEAKKVNNQLPDGLHYANKVIYDIIDGSQNFMMVSQLDDADYVLDVSVDAYPNKGINTPIIEYTLTLQDKDGREIDSWKQDIRQLQNDDKSWW